MIINNDTKCYYNQYFDIIDVPETPEKEPLRTCNITCIAMITGENPNIVLDYFFKKYGFEIGVKSPHFQWQELLTDYLEMKGFKNRKIIEDKEIAYPKARYIFDKELQRCMNEIKNGKVILYHKDGHYQIMTGFEIDNTGQTIDFIFNDPAGNRIVPKVERERESGHSVHYPYSMIKSEKIYGNLYAVEI